MLKFVITKLSVAPLLNETTYLSKSTIVSPTNVYAVVESDVYLFIEVLPTILPPAFLLRATYTK